MKSLGRVAGGRFGKVEEGGRRGGGGAEILLSRRALVKLSLPDIKFKITGLGNLFSFAIQNRGGRDIYVGKVGGREGVTF